MYFKLDLIFSQTLLKLIIFLSKDLIKQFGIEMTRTLYLTTNLLK